MIATNLPDVSPTREQMRELAEINGRGIDAQNEHFAQTAGTAPRVCHGCQERFDCGYTFSAYSGTIGQALWQQSRCDRCLSEPSPEKPAKKVEPRIDRYVDFDERKLPEAARKVSSMFLAWTPAESTGIGLIGLPATGKSYHIASNNRGCYPHNGAIRIRVNPDCVEYVVDDDWTFQVQ